VDWEDRLERDIENWPTQNLTDQQQKKLLNRARQQRDTAWQKVRKILVALTAVLVPLTGTFVFITSIYVPPNKEEPVMNRKLLATTGAILCATLVPGCSAVTTNNSAVYKNKPEKFKMHPAKGIILGQFAQNIAASKAVTDVKTPTGAAITPNSFINMIVVFNHNVHVSFMNGAAHDIWENFKPAISIKHAKSVAQEFLPDQSKLVGNPERQANSHQVVYTYFSQKIRTFHVTYTLNKQQRVTKIEARLKASATVQLNGNVSNSSANVRNDAG
jgi:hypothetical protein